MLGPQEVIGWLVGLGGDWAEPCFQGASAKSRFVRAPHRVRGWRRVARDPGQVVALLSL